MRDRQSTENPETEPAHHATLVSRSPDTSSAPAEDRFGKTRF